ncbi:proton-conducting transporter transmembrane domain-containing protein [Blastococcus goldschmidtiae]|uniref:Proton-conducting transporter membrane subunit n=1 Tax=Blastococcus goldschmidtiae TaxID=3075546 RepID=A0ABU2KDG0_9ACTN|nr:proton-conducting transporter membrane subunit [Blastococcus sp. DSM 46792]MDT0278225.1 proton-conducting transporter membrane subunit [Blastococcus sp. DSM 46792]
MVVAVAACTGPAIPALAIRLAGYAVTNVGALAAVAAAPAARTITDWATAVGRHQWLVVSLVVCLLGLVGTPPTAVFLGKLAVLAAAWDGGLVWLVVVAAVNTVASLFYYLRWVAPAFAGVPAAPSMQEGAGSGPRTAAGTAQRTRRGVPTGLLHGAAVMSLLFGLGSGWWLAFALST